MMDAQEIDPQESRVPVPKYLPSHQPFVDDAVMKVQKDDSHVWLVEVLVGCQPWLLPWEGTEVRSTRVARKQPSSGTYTSSEA